MKVKVKDLWKYAFGLQSLQSVEDTTQVYLELNETICPSIIESIVCNHYTKIQTMNFFLVKEENATVAETCAKDILEKKKIAGNSDTVLQYGVRKFKDYYAYQICTKNIPCDRFDFIMGRYTFLTVKQLEEKFNRAKELQKIDFTIDQFVEAGLIDEQHFSLLKSIFFEHKSFNVSIPEQQSIVDYNVMFDISDDLIGTSISKLFQSSIECSKNNVNNIYTWKVALIIDKSIHLARIKSIKLYRESQCIKSMVYSTCRSNILAYETECFTLDPILGLA